MTESKQVRTIDEIEPGKSYRIDFGDPNVKNSVIHVRVIVDEDQFVYRCWNEGYQTWFYHIEGVYWFELRIKNGILYSC